MGNQAEPLSSRRGAAHELRPAFMALRPFRVRTALEHCSFR